MTTTFAPGRSARSGFFDRARSAVAGLDWILLLGVVGHHGLRPVRGRPARPRPTSRATRATSSTARSSSSRSGSCCMIVATRVNLDRLARWAWALWGGLLGALAMVFVLGTRRQGIQPLDRDRPLQPPALRGGQDHHDDRAGGPGGRAHPGRRGGRATRSSSPGSSRSPRSSSSCSPTSAPRWSTRSSCWRSCSWSGVPWTHFAVFGSILAIVILGVLWILPHAGVTVLQHYQVERLTAFMGAERDSSDAGYQLDQSTTAIGSGGALGKGPGGATQAINDFLPEHHTDFIFAVTSEMFGFVGGGPPDLALCARALAGPADARPRLEPDRHAGGGSDRRDDRLPGVR